VSHSSESNPLDCFALLGVPRHPAPNIPALKQKFLDLSSESHPDRVHQASPLIRREAGAHFAALNAAWSCLANTKDRLAHLLAIERGRKPEEIHAITPETADRFLQVAQLCRRVDDYLARRAANTSPLLQARMIAETVGLADQIREMTAALRSQEAEVENSLAELGPAWDQAPAPTDSARAAALPLDAVESAWRSLSYLNRWEQQLQDRLARLVM
jgi:DnaJ-domain-containing protein 1